MLYLQYVTGWDIVHDWDNLGWWGVSAAWYKQRYLCDSTLTFFYKPQLYWDKNDQDNSFEQ